MLPTVTIPRYFHTSHGLLGRIIRRNRYSHVRYQSTLIPTGGDGTDSDDNGNLVAPESSIIPKDEDEIATKYEEEDVPGGFLRFYRSSSVENYQPTAKDRDIRLEMDGKNGGGRKDNDQYYEVHVDGRVVRSPERTILATSSYPLALALSAEWSSQGKYIIPPQMPLTRLMCQTLDRTAHFRDRVIEDCMNYLRTDSTLFFDDPDKGDHEELYEQQLELWSPLHKYCCKTFGSGKEGETLQTYSGVMAAKPQCPTLTANIRSHLERMDDLTLTSVQSITTNCKSIIIALAVEGNYIDGMEAIEASRCDEEYQISQWGMVQGGHDVDRANAMAATVAASLALRYHRSDF
eukprot:g502.t1